MMPIGLGCRMIASFVRDGIVIRVRLDPVLVIRAIVVPMAIVVSAVVPVAIGVAVTVISVFIGCMRSRLRSSMI
jgi:hypothetical protein